jgi:glutathione-regulated potassium-efflux system ancillary protein KefC
MNLLPTLALLTAAVLLVPLFRRAGLGSVLGYLVAGVVIGPFGLGVIGDTQVVLHVAELGVTLLMFLIGLELQPRRLWALRREVVGLGALQVVSVATVAGLIAYLPGLSALAAGLVGRLNRFRPIAARLFCCVILKSDLSANGRSSSH